MGVSHIRCPLMARAAAIASEMEYLGHAYFRGPAARFALATSRAHPLEDLRRLAALAHAHGIRLVLVIAPAHARHSESIAAAGLWAEWENWKRALVTINEEEAIKARATAFALWDFSGYNEVTMEPFPALDDSAPMRWYYESSHFTPAAGHRMLARISGNDDNAFGVLLTSANIEQELAAARLARASWREAHPSDAAEIDALAGDISSFRNLQGLR